VKSALDNVPVSIDATNLLVFTDLDGTLLDHDDYGFKPARPALRVLQERAVPLILTTSKTLAETSRINRALDNRQITIVENGGAICVPGEQSQHIGATDDGALIDGVHVIRHVPGYRTLRRFIDEQRRHQGFRLRGFGDMTASDIAALTGLGIASAGLAAQRLCSEPFLWDDSEERLRDFVQIAGAQSLRVTRGGRFWHLMGSASKATAMLEVAGMLESPSISTTTVALGDSDNDIEMLQQADIAVIVKRHDGTHLDCNGRQRTLLTEHSGPRGWNTAILSIVAGLGQQGTEPR
jgi:mannosyl-3-phosphoglycerate phosphatase